MTSFKIFFRHGDPVVVQASSAADARGQAADYARLNATAVLKVKRVRAQASAS